MTLALRILRGCGASVLGRWALVAGASAGTGLLLLSCLGWALAHPQRGPYDALVRLGWCVLPVVVTVQLASAVGRAQPEGWPRSGLGIVGLGRTGVAALSAVNSAVVCALGSLVALGAYLELRGDLTGVPFGGVGAGVLASGRPLPPAGAATLLALVPVAAAVTGAAGVRLPPGPGGDAPGRLPWGVALVAVGLALEVTAPQGHELPLPSGFGSLPPLALCGWAVTTAGMTLAGPGLVHACGRLIAFHRPGALRLLAGRALQSEAPHVGRPLALLASAGSAAIAAYDVHRPVGPVTAFAAALVALCVLATTGLALTRNSRSRHPVAAALHAVGASPALLRSTLTLRVTALLLTFAPLTVLVATLATLPRPSR